MRHTTALIGLACLGMPHTCLHADESPIEEVIVIEKYAKRAIYLEDALSVSPDTAQLLKEVPGGNVNGNGPLTGIPQYRGMYGPRIGITVNGATIAPAGPNWMDPPLSYAAPSQLVSLEVYRGIAPVSVMPESIGGAIVSNTKLGDFTHTLDWQSTGRVSFSGQTVNDASLLGGMAAFANQSHHVAVAAMSEQGDDQSFPGGKILPSEFDRQRGEVAYGYRYGAHTLEFGYTRNETGNAGTPALPMDIDYFDGDLYRAKYQYDGERWQIDAQLNASELVHGMTNYHLRPVPQNLALWRQNTTDVDNFGFGLNARRMDSQGHWLLGLDYFDEQHNGLIDNPNNSMFFVEGFNNASREVLGAFVEREQRFTDTLVAEIGVRVNQVTADADAVDATPARMMPPAMMLRNTFNAADRNADDTNVDAVAKLWWSRSDQLVLYAGLARKTRSASFVERYLWLPLQATGGLADGFTYTGNLDLQPEQSTEIEFGTDLTLGRFSLSPRIFVRDVDDFIQGTPSTDASAVMMVRMMNMANGTQVPDPLQFNNVDARFYGFDMDWRVSINDEWSVTGLLNYVRGERRDIDDDLYRIAPPNASFQLNYAAHKIDASLELVAYDDQAHVSLTNREVRTDGYELLNLTAAYQFNDTLRLAVGAENLLDETYLDHLAGYNRVQNQDIMLGSRLPGTGRNVFLRADIAW
ncbi:hypothetical protein GCM10008090_33550 [Arenicella chitinivorans]|uniref:TonB-dependent receptor n=1 Tax=Arenicella chitinivorans TaxID=1329800 RepID=A0A918S2S5_9GAMM|nr:TonB-dependent receptor [Arenicella chitinivorans]GHA20910.1 hypothetical protein GCM10008090_33550 [Arenicella chitinivorans]